jgi:NAD(P)-dependent dehydrogenase (short-subunit alcohol dehydrogenase family)
VGTVRQEAHRAELLAEAAAKGLQDQLSPFLCDITEPADVQRLAQHVAEQGAGLDALLNNAGTNYPGPLELMPLDVVRAQLEINLLAQSAVTQALLPAMKNARGTVMNVSSTGGRITLLLSGLSTMSKIALEAMSEVLRLELAHFGVKVVVVVLLADPYRTPTGLSTMTLSGYPGTARRTTSGQVYAPTCTSRPLALRPAGNAKA